MELLDTAVVGCEAKFLGKNFLWPSWDWECRGAGDGEPLLETSSDGVTSFLKPKPRMDLAKSVMCSGSDYGR
uniref:Uncharacterized protein n=1 Tax=Candidozyma auris TaxID=498019 RepID=A0A0L0P4U0_CANAR